jgi:hypothetical protein
LLLLLLLLVLLTPGVGHMAVQLGKVLGLYVVGVAGPANVEWVKQQLGADEVVDYKQEVGGWGSGTSPAGIGANGTNCVQNAPWMASVLVHMFHSVELA